MRAQATLSRLSRRFLPACAAGGTIACSAQPPQRRFAATTTEGSTSAAAPGGGISSEMKAKGFHHSTPNFNTAAFSDGIDTADLASDIVTESAVGVDFARDMYGPWLIMTDDLQGELFVDHDKFVYYRPANGLGYGIGRLRVLDAGATGTAFTCQLESYTYQPTETVVPQCGLTFDITGMVKRVTAKSSDYTTFSLVGVWRRTNRNEAAAALLPSQRGAKRPESDEASAEPDSTKASGQFNAAKLTLWDAAAATKPFLPNAELQKVFAQVFPDHLRADSHVRRAAAQRGAATPAAEVHVAGSTAPAPPPPAAVHVDLAKYAVGSLPGIYYIPDYVSAAEEAQMLKFVHSTPQELKSKLKKRTCQEWGCTMCETCQKSFVSDANMPPWVQEAVDMQVYDGLFTPTTFPNSVRIHEYQQGEGIGPHCDGPIYVPMVTVLSLASTSVMSFYPKQPLYEDHPMDHYNDTFKFSEGDIGKRTPLQSVVMEPRSLLIFSGEGYYHYPHGVSDRATDELTPELVGEVVNRHLLRDPEVQAVPRTYRVSITTRNLMVRCSHQPARAEYAMKRAWYLYNHLPVPKDLFTPPPPLPSTASRRQGSVPQVATYQSVAPTASFSPSGAVAGSDSELTQTVRELRAGQEELRRSIEELKELIALSIPAQTTYQKDTATVLNHLSSSVLELESKVDDLLEEVDALKGGAKDA